MVAVKTTYIFENIHGGNSDSCFISGLEEAGSLTAASYQSGRGSAKRSTNELECASRVGESTMLLRLLRCEAGGSKRSVERLPRKYH